MDFSDEWFMGLGGFFMIFGWMIWWPLSIVGVIMLMMGFIACE